MINAFRMDIRALLAVGALGIVLSAWAGPIMDESQMEWREVFFPDGTITRVEVPRQIDPPLDARTITLAAEAEVVPLQVTGPSSERIDLVFVGDGYTAAEIDDYHQHVATIWGVVTSVEPFSTYQDYFNVWMVNVVSNESGVSGDPYQNVVKDTALNMRFFCGGTERLLCVDTNKATAYAANAPEVDSILAVANSSKYGGAGYASLGIATVSGSNSSTGRVAVHEFGHSMGNLADEYSDLGGTWTGGEPPRVNVSTYPAAQMAQLGVKWHNYLGLPTPDGGTISTYEGAYRYSYGIYRSSQASMMRNSSRPFNLVGLDAMESAFLEKIHPGGIFSSRFGIKHVVGSSNCTTADWHSAVGLSPNNAGVQGSTNRRYGGPCGLRVGAANAAFLRSDHPNNEPTYNVRFYVFLDDASGDIKLFDALDGANNEAFSVWFENGDVTLRVATASGQKTATFQNIESGWHSIHVNWESKTAASVEFLVANRNTSAGSQKVISGNTSAYTISRARLGSVDGTAGSGTLDFDDFVSTRITPPGRLLHGDANNDGAISVGDLNAVQREFNQNGFAAGQPDCNEDGSISVSDLNCVLQIIDSQ